jgi:hypothetical protein
MNNKKEKKIDTETRQNPDYVFCIPGEKFSAEFLLSWSHSLCYLMSQSIGFLYTNLYTSLTTFTRNELIRTLPGKPEIDQKNMLPFEGKLQPKKIIFIDDDMVWNTEDLIKILKSDKDIVSGFYKLNWKNENNDYFLAAVNDEKLLTENDIKDKTELIELEGVGLGFIAINFDVFKTLKFPWFETFDIFDNKKNMVVNRGEDLVFCKKAIKAGYKIYGDPTIKIGHNKSIVLGFDNE